LVLTAVCAKISTLIFSIKHPEAFQIAASLPIPQPSTLIGALTYCLGSQQEIGLKAQEIVKRNVIIARARLLSDITIVNPIILKRFRILDKGFEKKEKGEEEPFKKALNVYQEGNVDTFRKIIEKDLTDALYREYLSPSTLKCIWILRSPIESKILYLLQRLGDTESLVNVTEVWNTECKVEHVSELTTSYYFTLPQDVIIMVDGNYTITKMCNEERKLRLYYIPCKKEIRSTSNGLKYFVYIPTKVKVKIKKPQEVYFVDEECIIGV
jgi:CRISPR-associated protein Cas5 subtype I-A